MRKIQFIIAMQIFHYLLWVFVLFDWNFLVGLGGARFLYVLVAFITYGISMGTIMGWDSGKTPQWLETPTHEEKKIGIRKYIGELHEELKLYGEAMDLQKRISEFRKK